MPVTLHTDGDIAVLTLDRPDRRNALDLGMFHALRAAAEKAEGARVVLVTGAAGHFSSGLDISPDNALFRAIGPATRNGDEEVAREVILDLKSCLQAIANLSCPTIAAIEGACIGAGLEIALACDMRIAGIDSLFALPEVRLGMVPDLGGTVRLTRLVGPGRAADLVCTGRRIAAQEAYALGVLERIVPNGGSLAAAREAAGAILENGPVAVRMALNTVRVAPSLGLDEALSLETRAGVMAVTSGEPLEGLASLAQKRPARWNG